MRDLLAKKYAFPQTSDEVNENNEDDGAAADLSALSKQELSDISDLLSRIQLHEQTADAADVLLQLIGFLAPLILASTGHTVHADDQVQPTADCTLLVLSHGQHGQRQSNLHYQLLQRLPVACWLRPQHAAETDAAEQLKAATAMSLDTSDLKLL